MSSRSTQCPYCGRPGVRACNGRCRTCYQIELGGGIPTPMGYPLGRLVDGYRATESGWQEVTEYRLGDNTPTHVFDGSTWITHEDHARMSPQQRAAALIGASPGWEPHLPVLDAQPTGTDPGTRVPVHPYPNTLATAGTFFPLALRNTRPHTDGSLLVQLQLALFPEPDHWSALAVLSHDTLNAAFPVDRARLMPVGTVSSADLRVAGIPSEDHVVVCSGNMVLRDELIIEALVRPNGRLMVSQP